MFATIPHYRLPELHQLLGYPEYTSQGLVVEGYFFPAHDGPGRNPTVLEVLGPEYARDGQEVFIDDSVVEEPHRPGRAA
jgi:hypothetical protein